METTAESNAPGPLSASSKRSRVTRHVPFDVFFIAGGAGDKTRADYLGLPRLRTETIDHYVVVVEKGDRLWAIPDATLDYVGTGAEGNPVVGGLLGSIFAIMRVHPDDF